MHRLAPGAPVTTDSQFVNAPKYTFATGAEYSTSVRMAWQLTGRIDYIHKTRIQYDYGNSPLVAQTPYGLLNAKITLQKPESHFSFFGFVTNLPKLMGPPREWGLGGQFRF